MSELSLIIIYYAEAVRTARRPKKNRRILCGTSNSRGSNLRPQNRLPAEVRATRQAVDNHLEPSQGERLPKALRLKHDHHSTLTATRAYAPFNHSSALSSVDRFSDPLTDHACPESSMVPHGEREREVFK